MAKRGNPKWLHPAPQGSSRPALSAFEKMMLTLGIMESQVAKTRRARQWVLRNYRKRFVPEPLLLALDISPVALMKEYDEELAVEEVMA